MRPAHRFERAALIFIHNGAPGEPCAGTPRSCASAFPSAPEGAIIESPCHRALSCARRRSPRAAMGRFASTVAFYESARPPYGAAFFAEVARALDFDGKRRLLDVGTGPGLLAIGFAPTCGEVLGVDPEPAMIEAAREAAGRAGVALRLIESRFEDLPASLGVFDVVAIGRALHWLDPEPARRTLERVVAPRGKILVCHAGSVKDGRNPWLD